MQEAISSAKPHGDKACAQVAATLGVHESHPPSSQHQQNTHYTAGAAELFEREFGGGGNGGAHIGSHTGSHTGNDTILLWDSFHAERCSDSLLVV